MAESNTRETPAAIDALFARILDETSRGTSVAYAEGSSLGKACATWPIYVKWAADYQQF